VGVLLQCQGDGIKLVRECRTKSVPFGKLLPQQAQLGFHSTALPGGYAGRQKKILSLCRCGVERVVPSQLPWSQVRDCAAEQERVVVAAIASRPLSPCRSVWGRS